MNLNTPQTLKESLILIVDDDQAISALLRHLLEREGFKVKTMFDGLEAKEYIMSNQMQSAEMQPALVLLEMMLPSINGYDLLEHIRSTQAWADVPVIVLSSLSQEDEIVRALKLGANDYVSKPFRVNELLARINRLI